MIFGKKIEVGRTQKMIQKAIIFFMILDVLYFIYAYFQTVVYGRWLEETSVFEKLITIWIYTDALWLSLEWLGISFLLLIGSFGVNFIRRNLGSFCVIYIIFFVQFRFLEEAFFWLTVYSWRNWNDLGIFSWITNIFGPNEVALISLINIYFALFAVCISIQVLFLVRLLNSTKNWPKKISMV